MSCGNRTHNNGLKVNYVITTPKDAEYHHISSISSHVGTRPKTTRLIVMRSADWSNRADAYHQQKFYHSDTNIYSVPATWNQWFCLHWSNLILIYQHIWKLLTLKCFLIEDTDNLHQFVASNLEKKGSQNTW